MRCKLSVGLLAMATLMGTALAQSNIDPAHKFAWGENIGWTNWYDAGAPPGDQGVVVGRTFLSGFIWAENAGWINVGDGSPVNGVSYANLNGDDFGVNIQPATDALYGYAWGENIGWVNFTGGSLAAPPNPARIDGTRLRGYVWGENVGWINLDGDADFVGLLPCDPCDANCDGSINGGDIGWFIDLLNGVGTPCSRCAGDTNADGSINGSDISNFIDCLNAP